MLLMRWCFSGGFLYNAASEPWFASSTRHEINYS